MPNDRGQAQTANDALDARGGFSHTIVEDDRPITGAQFQAGLDMLANRVAVLLAERDTAFKEAIRSGTFSGTREALDNILDDQARVQQFWRTGFNELVEHGSNGASQWIGKRLLTTFVVAILIGCVTWLVQTGRLK